MDHRCRSWLNKGNCTPRPRSATVGADLTTPFPGYHMAPYRPGAKGEWKDYDGQRVWFEKDRVRVKFGLWGNDATKGGRLNSDGTPDYDNSNDGSRKLKLGAIVLGAGAVVSKLLGFW